LHHIKVRGEKKFSSWIGQSLGVPQFGEKTRIGGVGRPGNRRLRWVMVRYAHTAWQHDSRLRGFYERFCQQKGEKSAVEAVAHDMARIVYYMLKRNEPYRGRKRGLTDRKMKEMEGRALRCLRN